MDRRTILAFVLIFVILLGSQMIMEKFYGKPTPPPVEVEQPVAASGREALSPALVQSEYDTPPAGADPAAEIAASADLATAAEALRLVNEGQPRQIVVVTPLYKATISTVGGRIVGWEGLEFTQLAGRQRADRPGVDPRVRPRRHPLRQRRGGPGLGRLPLRPGHPQRGRRRPLPRPLRVVGRRHGGQEDLHLPRRRLRDRRGLHPVRGGRRTHPARPGAAGPPRGHPLRLEPGHQPHRAQPEDGAGRPAHGRAGGRRVHIQEANGPEEG